MLLLKKPSEIWLEHEMRGMKMITWKCLFKLNKEELAEVVNDIKNGESYTVFGWEDVYPTDKDILKYATRCGI